MIHFIYGNPGTGKTSLIYSEILKDAKNGQDAILIVPEQYTVAAERDIINLIPPSSQIKIEVLNFTRLANRLFRIYGGLSYNYATKAHEKLLMWRAIKAALPFLREYTLYSADDYSLADSMLATYKELCATCVSWEQIESVADSTDNKLLTSKIKDISTICSIYNAMLSESFTDTNSELARLSELLNNIDCLKDFNIYIDGFINFTGIEHGIIREIMRQAQNLFITVGIPFPGYNGIDTISIKDCSDRLRRDCAAIGRKANTVQLTENYRSNSSNLKTVSSDLWIMDKSDEAQSTHSDKDTIELFKASDIYDECEFAAVKAKELIEQGYRYKDIAIIARNIDKYRGIIEPALENMNLKYFISEKTDLSISPIAKFILSAIKVITHGWQKNDIIAHLKTGLCGISSHDSDIFECYTSKWNISGKAFLNDQPWSMNPDGYTTTMTERGVTILQTANKVRDHLINKLKKFTAELKDSQSYRELCLATLNYLEELEVREQMQALATEYLEEGKIRDASDCAKMYEVALDALDYVCDSFSSDEKPDINTFATALRIAFSESELGSIPTSQDEIILGSANMLRTDNIKCAIILGACDGEFPASTSDGGLFNSYDREILINQGIPLSGNKESSASDELYYFRRAAASPSEKLIIFTRSDSEPSVAFTRLTNIFPDIEIIDTASLLLPRIKSLKAASEYAPLLSGTEEGYALDKLLCDFNASDQAKESIPVSAENDVLDSDVISKISGKELILTQSKTESYMNCKFAFSCKYQLKLDEGRKAEFSFSNIGTFIHYILEKFLYRVYIANAGIRPNNNEIENIVDQIIEEYISKLVPDDKTKNARLVHLIDRLKSSSLIIINDLLYELSDSKFKPEFFEMRIGDKDIPSVKVTLKNGTRVSITGIIDRVDIYRSNGNAYIRVVDYKTGNKTFSISDIEEGLNLQMLLYIFSLTKGSKSDLNKKFNGNPVAASITYLSVDSSRPKASGLKESIEESNIKRSGLILSDEEIIDAISESGNDKYLMRSSRKNSFIDSPTLDLLYNQICDVLVKIGESITSGDINAKPQSSENPCKYCRFFSICRTSNSKKGD